MATPSYYLGFYRPDDRNIGRRYNNRATLFHVLSGTYRFVVILTNSSGVPAGFDPSGKYTPWILASYPKIQLTLDYDTPISPVLDGPSWAFDWDTGNRPDGSHFIWPKIVEWDKTLWDRTFVTATNFEIDNDGAALTGARKLAVGPANYDGEYNEINRSSLGVLIDYPGKPPSKGYITQRRIATPTSEFLTGAKLWAEMMGCVNRNGLGRRVFVKKSGHSGIMSKQLYWWAERRTKLFPLIDGPRGIGTVGYGVGGHVCPEGELCYVTTNGSFRRIWPDGQIETLAGNRLKPGHEVPDWQEWTESGPNEFQESHWEHLGVFEDGPAFLNEPWDAIRDPANEEIYPVTDTYNHRVVTIDIKAVNDKSGPARIKTFAGSRAGEKGYRDGPEDQALFNECWAEALDPDGNLYISDTDNNAIRVRRPNGMVETVFKSTINPTGEQLGDIRYGFNRLPSQNRADFMRDGPFETASLIRPQGLRFDSEWNLIVGEKGLYSVRRINLRMRTIEHMFNIANADARKATLKDIVLDVDRLGVCGPKDDVGVVCWDIEAQGIYSKDGVRRSSIIDQLHDGKSSCPEGPGSRLFECDYPWFFCYGMDGSRWLIGTGTEQCWRFTKIRPDDPVLDIDKWRRGHEIYKAGTIPTWPEPRPSFYLAHGDHGQDQFGGENFDFLGMRSDEELRQIIHSGWGTGVERREIDGGHLEDLIYFIRWLCRPWQEAHWAPQGATIKVPFGVAAKVM